MPVWNRLCAPIPLPKRWPFAVGSSSGSPRQTAPPICTWPPSWPVSAIRLAGGVSAIGRTASRACKMPRAQVARRAFPPSARIEVLAMATKTPAAYHCPATRWSLDDLVAALWQHRLQRLSRSSIWRILEEADLKPHRSVYWLNSHDPDFEAKAKTICQLYLQALRFYQEGRLVICADEKTGMQILQRCFPTQPAQPGKPEKREYEYIRHGVRVLLASFVVPTGRLVWNLGPTRTSADWAAHLANVVRQLPAMQRYDWVVDNLNTHWSLEVCQLVAQWCAVPFSPKALQRGTQRRAFLCDPTHKHVFHFTPKHGSWLNQVELWFSVLARRFLKRGDYASVQDFDTACPTIWRSTIPITRIPIGGPIRANPWSGRRLLVRPAASSVKDEHGLVPVPNRLNGLAIHPGLINDPLHHW